MQGAPKRQMNAEEMLAELKRAVEASTPAPGAPPPSASTAVKPISAGREKGRSQIDSEGGRPVKSNPEISVGPRPALQKSPSSRSWKLIAGGLALAAAATVGVSFALMNKASNAPEREPSAAATERFVKEVAPVQAGEADAKHPPSAGAQSSAAAFTQTPPGLAATPVPSEVIRPDGTPIAPDRPSPASTDWRLRLRRRRRRGSRATGQAGHWDNCDSARPRLDRFSASASVAQDGSAAAGGPQPPARPGEGTVATAPAAASTDLAHSPQTPKTAAAPAAAPTAKPNEGTIATAPPSASRRIQRILLRRRSRTQRRQRPSRRICRAIGAEARFREEIARENAIAKASQERESLNRIGWSGEASRGRAGAPERSGEIARARASRRQSGCSRASCGAVGPAAVRQWRDGRLRLPGASAGRAHSTPWRWKRRRSLGGRHSWRNPRLDPRQVLLAIRSALAAQAQKPGRKVFDVDADAVSAQRVGRVDHGDGQLELAHDREDGDGERSLSARGRAQEEPEPGQHELAGRRNWKFRWKWRRRHSVAQPVHWRRGALEPEWVGGLQL